MEQIIRIGMDTSKHIFQLHGVDAAEQAVLRKQLAPQARCWRFLPSCRRRWSGWRRAGGSHYLGA